MSATEGRPLAPAWQSGAPVLPPTPASPVHVWVDGDPSSARLPAIVPRAEGCQVEMADSAAAALVVPERVRPDLGVLELVLPRRSGALLAERLRTAPGTKDAVFVAMTTFEGGVLDEIVADAGSVAWLRTPGDPPAVPARLFTLLGAPR